MKDLNVKTRVLHSETFDPWFNLATEDWIFRDMDPEGHVLFLWRNTETVVIGRYQNPWLECRLEEMNRDGVKLARRQSGGGAVYQDRQNLNFTFMSGIDVYDKKRNFDIIVKALKRFGIDAEVSGRNDITVDGKKISGSAFKLSRDRAFHHGTLLVDVDLKRLANYLNPDQIKLKSKGIKSVKSRVVNLKEVNPEIRTDKLAEVITEVFFDSLGSGTEEHLDLTSLQEIPHLVDYYDLLKSEEWLYRKSPDFSHKLTERYEWGGIEVHLDIKKGMIDDVEIFSDCLLPEMIESIQAFLKSKAYSFETIGLMKQQLGQKNGSWQGCLDDVESLLESEIHRI